MSAVAARARGRLATVLAADTIDGARDARELAALLGTSSAGDESMAAALDRAARARVAEDLAILARWTDELQIVALDEDRRSVRALVRGLAARIVPERRIAGTLATAGLPARTLERLAHAASAHELAAALGDHPFAVVIANAATPLDLIEVEVALARRFVALARTRDRALRTYVAQTVDAENAAAALLLSARGGEIDASAAFVAGGRLLDEKLFTAAAQVAFAAACDRIARAFAATPLAAAVYAADPAALEAATLAWQLATQARLRLAAPLGLAPALYLVLRRRDEVRRIRRASWRFALGGTG